ANNPALASIPTTGSSNQFLYNDDRQHEFEPETRPYYGSLGRSPQPHQPHHRQQRQSRIGDKMRHSLDSEQRQQRQQQQRTAGGRPITDAKQNPPAGALGETVDQLLTLATAGQAILTRTIGLTICFSTELMEGGGHAAPARRPGQHQDTAGQVFVDRNCDSNGNIRQAAAAQLSYSASAQPPTGHLWPACDGAARSAQPFATAGRLPFAPKQRPTSGLATSSNSLATASDLEGPGHFVGRLPGRTDYYVGVELDQEEGKHDGSNDVISSAVAIATRTPMPEQPLAEEAPSLLGVNPPQNPLVRLRMWRHIGADKLNETHLSGLSSRPRLKRRFRKQYAASVAKSDA
uniref:CG-1 domain-containing protein n=1 Tax=Macrostomum lignano TaxID=282301 RepID=A0A1I8F5I2_9PLAT